MSVATCPEGHASDDPAYCSVCGAKIDGAAPAAPTAAGGDTCPHCGAGRDPADKFCESCGYDFVSGTVPAAPAAPAAPPSPAAPTASPWWAVVSADRAFYDRNEAEEVQFPLGAAERKFHLTGEKITIGRRSASRGVEPTIDLSDPPEDAAVSHGHATLLRQTDGSYALVDNASTNGTYVKDSTDPLAPNTPVPLADGDYFNLGAFTRITIERRD